MFYCKCLHLQEVNRPLSHIHYSTTEPVAGLSGSVDTGALEPRLGARLIYLLDRSGGSS